MSWKYYRKVVRAISSERAHALVHSPLVTEKSTFGAERNEYSFKVAMDANKAEIKQAIEKVFEVKVESVNTGITKGKTKRFRGVMGKRKSFKKAIVRLAEGDSIDFGTNV